MIEQMSPLTRRIVAVGMLVLLILLVLQYVIVPLAGAIASQRDELAALRTREARLHATLRRDLPKASSIRPAQAVTAPNAIQATQHLQALLAGDAAVAGATLQLGPPCPPSTPTPPLCVEIAISGREASVSHFLSLAEHGTPLIRFRPWQLTPGQGNDTQLHWAGRALAVWRSPS